MRYERMMDCRLAGALALCLSSVATFAAEVPAPGKAPAAPAGAEPEKKPDTELPAALEGKPFKFEMGTRRDPFVYISEVPDISGPVTPGPQGGPAIGPIDKKIIEQVKAEAEAHYAEAYRAFQEFSKEGKAQEAINKCDEGLKLFAPFSYAGSVDEWREIRENLFDLRKAADKVRQRQEAKKKFDELNIRLTGIVSRERNSQAIVNSKTVRKGDVVAASDAYDVVVDEIRNDQVVFVFQGFKMALNLSEGPK